MKYRRQCVPAERGAAILEYALLVLLIGVVFYGIVVVLNPSDTAETIKHDLTTEHYKVVAVHMQGDAGKPTVVLYDTNGCKFTYDVRHANGHYKPYSFAGEYIAPSKVGHDSNNCSYFPAGH